MNMFQLQERIKDFSKDQLIQEMQQPSGAVPPFLVLSELQRRTRMEQAFTADQAQGQQSTVAQDAIAAAGVPQGGIADMARAMAPQTDMAGNTGAMPVQNMQAGGEVRGPMTAEERFQVELRTRLREARDEYDPLMEALSDVPMYRDYEPGSDMGLEMTGFANIGTALRRGLRRLGGEEPVGEMMGRSDELRRYIRELERQRDSLPPGPNSLTSPRDSGDVFRMADGGVVRMQPGGLAGVSRDLDAYSPTMGGARGPQRPRLVVRNGIQYAEMPDGSLIPIGELGFSPEQQAGIDSADLSAPTGFTAPSTGSLPTQADLDQRFADRDLGITGTARQLGSPSLSDIPQLPGADTAVGGSRRAFDMPTPARDMELPLVESLLGESSLDIRVPPSAESLGFVPEGEGPYTEAVRSDIERQRRRLTPADYQSRGETDPLDPRSPSYVPPVPDDFDYQNARYNEAEAARMMELNAIPFAGGEYVPPPTSAAPSALGGIGRLFAAGAGVALPQMSAEPIDPMQGPNMPLDPVDPSEFGGLPDFMTDPGAYRGEPYTRVADLFGLGPAFDAIPREPDALPMDTGTPLTVPEEADGGIESLLAPARPPAGGGGAGGTGGAGARATGTADADKWLALAQFGLGLMASQQPTLGGAIGEAGTMALGQLRESQKEAYERDLAERTLAARSAGGSRGPSFGNLISLANARITAAQSALERLNMDGITDLEKAVAEGRGDEFRSATADLLDANNMLRSLGPALTGGASLSDVEIDLTQ